MAFSFGFFACENKLAPLTAARHLLAIQDLKLVLLNGDTPYYSENATAYGYTCAAITPASTVSQIKDHVHQMMAKPGWKELLAARSAGLKLSWMADDHRWWDNEDHSLATASGTGAATQAQVTTMFTAWYTAHRELANTYWDYPLAAVSATSNGDRPEGALLAGENPAASVFPIFYHLLDLDENGQLGGTHTRIIRSDDVTYRDLLTKTDNASKKAWGTVARAWLDAAVRDAHDAGFKFIFVVFTKATVKGNGAGRYGTGSVADSLAEYSTDLTALLAGWHAYGARPVILSGDTHTPHVTRRMAGVNGSTYDSLDVSASPVGVVHLSGYSPHADHIFVRSNQGLPGPTFGLVQISDAGARLSLRDGDRGGEIFGCTVAARSNTPILDGTAAVVRVA